MTRKEFFSKDCTWKSAALRLAVAGNAERIHYKTQMFHMGINQSSSLKHFTMTRGMSERAKAIEDRISRKIDTRGNARGSSDTIRHNEEFTSVQVLD